MAECAACGTQLVESANFCSHCGTPRPERLSEDPLIGKLLGNYRVLSVLGAGAMGNVYRGEQITLKRPVCIKTIKQHLAADPTMIERFEREAVAASMLSHPNIVGVYEVGSLHGGLLYIVMELIEGPDLGKILRETSPLPLDRALGLMEQITSALEEAHGRGIVHRDLKPDNVLVATLRDGRDLAKVLDFGLAKLLDQAEDAPRLTKTGAVFGTPAYMAPEQILGDPIDGRADVYAAGVMLYEMAAGVRPFTGTMPQILRAKVSERAEPPSLRSAVPIPAELDKIVLRALEIDPAHRYASALELKHAIEHLRRRSSSTEAKSDRARFEANADPTEADLPDRLIEHLRELHTRVAGDPPPKSAVFGEPRGAGGDEARLFVGREEELEAIGRVLRTIKAKQATAIVFLGDAGLGKTALLDQAHRTAHGLGIRAIHVSSGRASLPFDLVRRIAEAVPQEDLGLDPADARRVREILGRMPRSKELDLEETMILDRAALLTMLERVGRGGVCVVADDLHLADAESLELLGEWLLRSHGAVGLVGAARPVDSERLPRALRRMELAALPGDRVEEIAASEMGGADLGPLLRSTIVESAGGNPWLARQIARGLVESGAVEITGKVCSTTVLFDAARIPNGAGPLIRSRFDLLSGNAKRLLRFAAAIGSAFDLELLKAAVNPPLDVDQTSLECIRRGFLVRVDGGRGGFEFAQAVVHETVLGTIAKPDLRYIHLRIADAIVRGAPSGDEPAAQALARHYLAADEPRKAADHLASSAERLLERQAFSAAAEQLQLALDIVAKDIETPSGVSAKAADRAFDLAAKAIEALSMVQPERALRILEPIAAVVPESVAPSARAEALRQHGRTLLLLSRGEAAEDAFRRALTLLSLSGAQDLERIAEAKADLAAAYEARGEAKAAAKELLEAFRVTVSGKTKGLWRFLNQLGRVHLKIGEPARAKEFFENAEIHARRADSPLGQSKALTNLGALLAQRGAHAEAAATFERALRLAESAGDKIGVARIEFNSGKSELMRGRLQEALRRLERSRDLSRALGWREGVASALQAIEAAKKASAGHV